MTDDGAVTSTPPHATDAAAVAAAFGVQPTVGLTDDEAARRLAESGANLLARRSAPPLWRMAWDAATEPFILVLLASGAMAVFLGEVRDGLLVLVGLLPIVVADVVTEFRAERALEALHAASAPIARVRRAGVARDIPAADLVPGDIVLLRVGDVVPADLRLLETDALPRHFGAWCGTPPRSRSSCSCSGRACSRSYWARCATGCW